MYKTEQMRLLGLENTIRDTSEALLKAVQQFAENKDFMKYVIIDRVRVKTDSNGTGIYERQLRVLESPCVNIKQIKHASDIMTKLVKALGTITKLVNSYELDYSIDYSGESYSDTPSWQDTLINMTPEEKEEQERKIKEWSDSMYGNSETAEVLDNPVDTNCHCEEPTATKQSKPTDLIPDTNSDQIPDNLSQPETANNEDDLSNVA